MSTVSPSIEPLAVRIALVRRRLPLYEFAALVHVHPARLGRMLNERVPMPPEVAERIARVLGEGAGVDGG